MCIMAHYDCPIQGHLQRKDWFVISDTTKMGDAYCTTMHDLDVKVSTPLPVSLVTYDAFAL